MKKTIYVLLISIFFSLSNFTYFSHAAEDKLVQLSTIDALLEGYYDGFVSVLSLKEKGDFGIGTVNGLDGELIVLDGKFYHIKSDGKAYELLDNDTIPFADIVFFESQKQLELKESVLLPELKSFLDAKMLSPNVFMAVKITGNFKKLKVRSVPKQEKPYKKLKEIVNTSQQVFDYENITGTIVGFRSPSWVSKIGVPGYHFHFIDEKFQVGGHILALESDNILIDMMTSYNFELMLPKDDVFHKLNLEEDKEKALKVVETRQS